jgi:hypothetical protein
MEKLFSRWAPGGFPVGAGFFPDGLRVDSMSAPGGHIWDCADMRPMISAKWSIDNNSVYYDF